MKEDQITFSFGENWKNVLGELDEDDFRRAGNDIEEWLGAENIKGKRIIDIGSGSGIHSFVFHTMGAKELISFDYDKNSVEATTQMWRKAGSPVNWKVMHGSILDEKFIKNLGEFDIVYSWGVLHHTGQMWKAIANACSIVKAGGNFWISIYLKGPRYDAHLELKRKYNRRSSLGKNMMVYVEILKTMKDLLVQRKNPFKWNQKIGRGMRMYNDIIDWLGGLPYEVASKEEIVSFCGQEKLMLKKVLEKKWDGGCNVYLFNKE